MARRMRLLDPRQRVGGVPHEVLASQLEGKRRVAEAEQAEDAFYAQSAVLQDQILQTVEGMKALRARDRQMAVVDYSLANLRKEQRREYALSDPDALKRETLPDPEDPSFGPSSMLKFPSHGKASAEAKRQSQEDQAAWLEYQVQEKLDRQAQEKAFDKLHDDRAMLASQVRAVCEDNEMQEQRDAKCEEAAENLRLAQAAKELQQAKKAEDDALKQKHIDTVLNSEWIGEMHDAKIGLTGKPMKAEYKRLTLEEEQEIYNSNARQLLDKQAKKNREILEKAEDASKIHCNVAVLGALEEERVRQQQERRMRMVEENKRLAFAKKEADRGERIEYFKYDP
ncbi:unnamed protein product [Symbiodinium pilosum]|uniref:RIB43A-like with coiled-coils protein 2 n=1 Tax=Symbiodinium pilosum TaxID=2952 RepID=A0A812PBP2_SYMPI|nr:unnamed protein product [Symbiodinium pilosum]